MSQILWVLRDLIIEVEKANIVDLHLRSVIDRAKDARIVAIGRRRARYIRSQLESYGDEGSSTARDRSLDELLFIEAALDVLTKNNPPYVDTAIEDILSRLDVLNIKMSDDLNWAYLNSKRALNEYQEKRNGWNSPKVQDIISRLR